MSQAGGGWAGGPVLERSNGSVERIIIERIIEPAGGAGWVVRSDARCGAGRQHLDIVERETSVSCWWPRVRGSPGRMLPPLRRGMAARARDCSKSGTTDRGIFGYRMGMDEAFGMDGGSALRQAGRGLAVSVSNQARQGRLVDAWAARGDEGRDTLR